MKRNKKIKHTHRVTKKKKTQLNQLTYYLISFLIVIVFIVFYGRPEKKTIFRFKADYKKRIESNTEYLKNSKIKIVFLGNSMIRDGFDVKLFERITDLPVMKASPGGVASAYWYLYLKNRLINIDYNGIELIVITFRDYELTDPFHGVNGYYIKELSKINTNNEPLLERLSYKNQANRFEDFFISNFKVIQQRFEIKEKINKVIKKSIEKMFTIPATYGDTAINNTFAVEKMNVDLQTQLELNEKNIRFEQLSTIKNTYLPEILKLAKEHKKKILFVRYKKRIDLEKKSTDSKLMSYKKKLSDYLLKEGFELIDFTDCSLIKHEHYKNGDHFNEKGKALFTKLLADSITTKYKFQRVE